MKRREILKIGAAAAGLGFPAIIRAQQKEVVMLGLWDQTGAFADVGPLNDRGMRMALEERDMKILGRPVKYVTRDGATQAGTSTRRAEEADMAGAPHQHDVHDREREGRMKELRNEADVTVAYGDRKSVV